MPAVCWLSPKVKSAIWKENAASKRAPNSPSTTDTHLNTVAVRAILSASPVPTASAIWRTPLSWIPRAAKVCARSAMELYRPMRPTPCGPRSTAIALLRTMAKRTFTTDAPPIMAVDFKIWTWDDRPPGLASEAIDARSASGGVLTSLHNADHFRFASDADNQVHGCRPGQRLDPSDSPSAADIEPRMGGDDPDCRAGDDCQT